MGFVGNVLSNVNGIHWYYITGLLIFLGLFITIVYRTIKIPKAELLHHKQSILDKDDLTDSNHKIDKT